ncbi:organic cation transporter-like protein [Contarinia nasturtii]|uniref:organic cation transporter-like protein n=1 Tax=Contarinia nasturtii TaxID=265458 RepID=UPI0012D3B473|nr:organic cation transporter-like protein [Contarinia nasturtii]XP_031635396.1 organic cation transporter-like protein [Contarinia nasturtii]XP_031635397.1 organic cation transporter-like protein [Contarinia nasturtii]
MCSVVLQSETQSKPNYSINDLIGEWGLWQQRSVLFIFLCKLPAAWFMACIIFTAPFAENGEYHCQQENYTRLGEIDRIDFCRVDVNQTVTIPPQSSHTDQCEKFTHHSIFNSLVTQFDLVCSRRNLIAITQFFHLLGVLCGGILANELLVFVSPKNVFLIGIISQIICGCLTGLVNNFKLHVFFRCLTAICCCQMYTAGGIIFSDICGGKYRKSVCVLFESFWGLGIILLPIVSLVPAWSWSSIYLAISLPTVAYILIWFWIPDSVSWLLRHAKLAPAKNNIFYAIQVNKRTSHLPSNLDSFLQHKAYIYSKEPKTDNWTSLWSTKMQFILMFALHIAWAVDVTNYNGMLLNIRAFGRKYLIINTIAMGICELIGVFAAWFIVMNAHKNKFLYSGLFNIVAGILSFIFPSTLSGIDVAFGMTLAMISKIATTCSQAVLYTCTAELLPAPKRNICMFSCVVWARTCLLTAPFICTLTFVHNLFPLAAFGFIEICGGICSCIVDRIHNTPRATIDKNSNEVLKNIDNSLVTTTHM